MGYIIPPILLAFKNLDIWKIIRLESNACQIEVKLIKARPALDGDTGDYPAAQGRMSISKYGLTGNVLLLAAERGVCMDTR